MKQNPTLGKENCPVYLSNSYDSLQSEQFIENPQRVDANPWGVSSADQLAGDAPEIDDTGNRTCSDSVDIDSSLSVGSQSSFCLETDNFIEFAFSSKWFHVSNLNIRHIVPKIDEIRVLMANENCPDVLGICEMFLHKNNPDSQMSISGYSFFRKDRSETQEKQGGGLLLYFK